MIQRRLALLLLVWGKQEYRTFLILMVLMSLATSSSMPLISLYLVKDLGVSLTTAGLFFTGMAVPGLIGGVVIGRRSDRWPSRVPFIRRAAVWIAAGWLALALSPIAWLTMAAGVVFLSAGGIIMGQVFATLHDVMTREGESQPGLINTTVRTGWSFGFVFGPVVGSALAAQAGFRATFAAAACLFLFCLVPLWRLRVDVPPQSGAAEAEGAVNGRPNLALYIFVALCAVVLSSQTIRNTYLPFHVTAHLGGSIGTYGTIVAVSPVLELFTMPLAGILAQRMGSGRLIAGGMLLGTLEYALLGTSNALWQIYAIQAMDAWLVAVLLGLGVTYAQQLSRQRPGAASSLFFSSFNLSGILGSVVGSASVSLVGVPHVFLIPAALCAAAWVTFMGIERVTQRRAVQADLLASQSDTVTVHSV